LARPPGVNKEGCNAFNALAHTSSHHKTARARGILALGLGPGSWRSQKGADERRVEADVTLFF